MVLRAYILLGAVLKSVVDRLSYGQLPKVTFQSTVHEDNQGALILATLEEGRHTLRSKFYALRLH